MLRISSALEQYSGQGPSAADVFGQYDWALTEAIRQNPNVSRANLEFVYRQVLSGGGHRAMTPPQEVKLVHAVRTPLYAPNFVHRDEDSVAWGLMDRAAGDTFALGLGKLVYGPRSTGRLDIDCTWNDYVDRGPGGPDPRVAIPKAAHAPSPTRVRPQRRPRGHRPRRRLRRRLHRRFRPPRVRRHQACALATYRPKAAAAFLPYFREYGDCGVHAGRGRREQDQHQWCVGDLAGSRQRHRQRHGVFRGIRENEDFVIHRDTGEIERKFQNGIPRIRQRVTVSFIRGSAGAARRRAALRLRAEGRVRAVPRWHVAAQYRPDLHEPRALEEDGLVRSQPFRRTTRRTARSTSSPRSAAKNWRGRTRSTTSR